MPKEREIPSPKTEGKAVSEKYGHDYQVKQAEAIEQNREDILGYMELLTVFDIEPEDPPPLTVIDSEEDDDLF